MNIDKRRHSPAAFCLFSGAAEYGCSLRLPKKTPAAGVQKQLHFTGKTEKRPAFPEYTYCEVYEEPKKYWVAVHDGQTQILDNPE